MSDLKPWKVSIAEAYAASNEDAIRGYMEYVVEPSMRALTKHAEALAASDDLATQAFGGIAHRAVIETTSRALCLGLQSLWEQQLRSILGHWASQQGANRFIRDQIISNNWNEVASAFEELRGLPMKSFGAHERLELLRHLGSVCRHGEGRSARLIRQNHPEWLSRAPDSAIPGPVLVLPVERLKLLANGILHFWVELDLLSMEWLHEKDGGYEVRISYLRNRKSSLA